MFGAIVPEEVGSILRDIEQLSASNLEDPDKVKPIIAKFKDKMAILDLLSRGLKIPIDVDPQIIVRNLWNYLHTGGMELMDATSLARLVKEIDRAFPSSGAKHHDLVDEEIKRIRQKVQKGVNVVLLGTKFPDELELRLARKIFL